MFFDLHYLLWVVLPVTVLGLIAQGMVKAQYHKYSRVIASSNLTGAEAAYAMLRSGGLEDRVRIDTVEGELTDHYDPREKVLRLSPEVFGGHSIAAIGIACHEVGHALQDASGYAPLAIRNLAVPTANFGSNAGPMIVFLGLILSGFIGPLGVGIAWLGVAIFGATLLFQLVNLPVEFNASARAKELSRSLGLVKTQAEIDGVAKVLNAAALTYVVATLGALLTMLYYISLLLNRRN